MRLWLLYQKYRRSKLCSLLTCSSPLIEAMLRHLSATRRQSPFAVLSDSLPCYGMVISPLGFTRLSLATLPCRTQNLVLS